MHIIQDPYVATMLCMQMPRLFYTLLATQLLSANLQMKKKKKRKKNVTKIWHQTWNSLNLFGLFVAVAFFLTLYIIFVLFPFVLCLFFFF